MIADLKPYREYKETGLPWLGKVPEHWEIRRMKYVVRETDSRSINGKEQLLRVSQFTGVTQRLRLSDLAGPDTRADSLTGYKRVEPNDLVINIMLAWNGSMGVSRYSGIASPAYCVYRFESHSSPWYFHHLLRSPVYKSRIKAFSTGVVESRLRLYSDDLYRIEAMLPPPSEQTAIVRFLDWANGRLERTIRAKLKVIALLNEQKQAIIHRAVTRGLNPAVPLRPSGIPWLGDIPEHWGVSRVKSVLIGRLANGVFKRGDAFGSGVPLVNVINIYESDGKIHPENLEKVQATAKEIATFRVLAGDLFFVRSSLKLEGTGRCAFVESIDPDTVFECHVVRAKPEQHRIEPRFLAMFLGSWIGVNNTVSRANTVTMSTLSQGAINSLPIVVPPLLEQRGILEWIDVESSPLTIAINRFKREIELLREYRIRLAADVVTGKLDVHEAAARLPDEAAPDIEEESFDLNDEIEIPDEEIGS
jgi:type I restriction enzyme S subunit